MNNTLKHSNYNELRSLADQSMLEIIFWEEIPSLHLSALLQSLANFDGISVTLVCQNDLPLSRQEMGWHIPEFENVRVLISPSKQISESLIKNGGENRIHVFAGLRAYPMVWNAFQTARLTNSRICIYAETGDWAGIKGWLRIIRNRMDVWRFGKSVDVVFAIGKLGVNWYIRSGFPSIKVAEFGYFVDLNQLFLNSVPTNVTDELSNSFEKTFRIIFVGSLNFQKGIDILLTALGQLRHLAWNLEIIGTGPERNKLELLAKKYDILDRVNFQQSKPNQETLQEIYQSDLLVLPSRLKEGWGVVVNEALLCGVPVICSQSCGASVLLDDEVRGAVVEAGSSKALKNALALRIEQGKLNETVRQEIMEWSKAISGVSAASYFLEVLNIQLKSSDKPLPRPPWYSY